MTVVTRFAWFLVQLLWSGVSLAWLALTSRRGTLVLRHWQDVDASGRDVQMGALVDRLRDARRRVITVALVPLDRSTLAAARRWGPFISVAAIFGPARLLGGSTRDRRSTLARFVLRVLAPGICYLVDESGSGQCWVRSARALGIPTVGVQHGDFSPDNPQYAATNGAPFEVEPADILCVWSSWFADRLHAVSPIYGADRTVVTGRARPAPIQKDRPGRREGGGRQEDARSHGENRRGPGPIDALLVADADPDFEATVAPFVKAIMETDDIRLRARHHPSATRTLAGVPAIRGDLATVIRESSVVLGVRSSALLEASWHRRPAVSIGPARRDGVTTHCSDPRELPDTCRRLAAATAEELDGMRGLVWGPSDGDAAAAIVAAGDRLREPAP